MKYVWVLPALGCLVTAVHAQWLETTIHLPDGLGKWAWPWCLVYDSANNTIYAGAAAGDCVFAIDGATNHVIAHIPSGSDVQALCYNSTNNKVYCANNGGSSVTVIDGATDGAVVTIGVGAGPIAFAWNPVQNRVHVANHDGLSISVLRDSVLGIQESPKPQAPGRKLAAKVIRSLPPGAVAFDAMGRRAVDPKSGVYFVRDEGRGAGDAGRTRKVVLQR